MDGSNWFDWTLPRGCPTQVSLSIMANVFLCSLDEVGRLKPVLGVPKVSISGPAIIIDQIRVENASLTAEGEMAVDVAVWGRVAGERYDHLPDGSGEPRALRFYNTENDGVLAEIPIQVERGATQGWKRPYPYHGTFAFTLRVGVCEGNNVFCLSGCDQMNMLDSDCQFVMEFEIQPKDGSGLGEDVNLYDHLDRCEIVLAAEPAVICHPPEGECHLYTLAIADPTLAHDPLLTVTIPGKKNTVLGDLPTSYDPASGWRYLCLPGSSYPAMFSLQFGRIYDGRAGISLTYRKLLKGRASAQQLPPDQRFRFGFQLGMGFSCLDLSFSAQGRVLGAMHYNQGTGGMLMPVILNPGRGKPLKLEIGLPVQLVEAALQSPKHFDLCEFFLYSMKLFAAKDPRADEWVLAMLTESWEGIGLAGYEIRDCRKILFHYGPEVLEGLLEGVRELDPLDHGLHLGQGVAAMYKTLIEWREKNGVGRYFSKADFLDKLG